MKINDFSYLVDNLHILKTNIHHLAKQLTCPVPRLIAVSKTQSTNHILAALNAGQFEFGENYVQEFLEKYEELRDNTKVIWHFIGHLQSNKAKYLVGKVSLIHSLDRLSLAKKIQEIAAEKNTVQHCLLQIKISKDTEKTGCAPEDVRYLFQEIQKMKNIKITGLMCLSSVGNNLEQIKKEFLQLKSWQSILKEEFSLPHTLTELSMGMSDDYNVAIACGSTMVRIGSKIFGARQ